jgi:hypothetical protein
MPVTGNINDKSGIYNFAGHVDGSTGCPPTEDEREIPLAGGERFPPIRSCGKAAVWELARNG